MDLADLKRQATAAREFSVSVGTPPRHITLRTPTEHELTLAARRAGMHSATDDVAASLVLERALVCACLVAWSGVTVGDVLPDSDQAAQPLDFEAGAVPLLLDAKHAWAQELWAALVERLADRRVKKDTAEKN
jgi:nucleotide-binding universal stress UspA family protein